MCVEIFPCDFFTEKVAFEMAGTKTEMQAFFFWAILSICSSVGIILVNKVIMSTYGFNFVFSLTSMHFFAQAVVLESMVVLGVLRPNRLPFLDNLLTAMCGVASIGFMNFNLRYNSVGFYQMTKLLCIPLMVLIQTQIYGKIFSNKIKFSLFLVCVGVGIAVVTDFEVNLLGCVYGLIAVLSTTQFQIWQGSKKEQYRVTPLQITHSVSFPLAVLAIFAAFCFETNEKNSVLLHEFSGFTEVFLILLSCALAISVNMCSFTLIAISSSVTYQVIGHFKTALVLLGGLVLFRFEGSTERMLNNLSGVVIAMAGVILYGHLKNCESSKIPQRDFLDYVIPSFLFKALRLESSAAQYEQVELSDAQSDVLKV